MVTKEYEKQNKNKQRTINTFQHSVISYTTKNRGMFLPNTWPSSYDPIIYNLLKTLTLIFNLNSHTSSQD
ncbi:hypothetical protein Hanom_Chr13g01212921 [Helianthus anomalus]